MALPPKFKGHRLIFPEANASSASGGTLHTLEFYLDYVCPFSAKLFDTLTSSVIPLIRENPQLASRLQLVFRHQVQPWHPSSTLVHEAALAVNRLLVASQERHGRKEGNVGLAFWNFSKALFQVQVEFFDLGVVAETRNATYRRLAALAQGALPGEVSQDEVYGLLEVKAPEGGGRNTGNQVTDDLKQVIKLGRQNGVHVSPTVLFDGVVANEISSGWTVEQWKEWLEKNVV